MSEPKNLGSAHDLRALLTAVLEAVTLPAGDVEYARRLETRANWVHATVKGALAEDPADIGWNADFLRQKLVEEQAAAEQRAVRRSVDAQFPAIAAVLADERGDQ